MLSLSVEIETTLKGGSFVLKLDRCPDDVSDVNRRFYPETISVDPKGNVVCRVDGNELIVKHLSNDELLGDVLLCHPNKGHAQRLIRRNSQHNTILFTERCDQMCAMCSQPPKDRDYSPLFGFYRDAILLADEGVRVGISGGEPTLYLDQLIEILEAAAESRSDINFHILTNCQHFDERYEERLEALHQRLNILWGVPLYSHDAITHDEIVGKVGAFENLMAGFYRLAATGASIELRTVLTARNAMDFPRLAQFIAKHLPFISFWAIMAMEPIGFAKANKEELFFDHSAFPEPLISGVQNSLTLGIRPELYNFPLCTIPKRYREFCNVSISDWKRKYLDTCKSCAQDSNCTGFFEWYNDSWEWEGVRPLNSEGNFVQGEIAP